MKVVILAAGKGSRLDNVEGHAPKALTQLMTGQSILQLQLDVLSHFLSLDQVFVVVGYHKEKIMAAFPDLIYIYNSLYEKENTAKSLLRALYKIEEDVLWLNGDVIFRPSVIQQLLEQGCTAMVVNQAEVDEEEVKYRTDGQGRILEVSKQVLAPEGEALGINFFKHKDVPQLRENLKLCQSQDYFEKAIELGIQQGQDVRISLAAETDCAEIDFPEDLIHANQLLKKWEVS